MAVSVQELIRQIEQAPDLQQRLSELLIPVRSTLRRPKLTYEQFLAGVDEDLLAEWVNGEVVMSSPASYVHQNLSGFLTSVLRTYIETRHLGVIFSAPFQMRLAESGREPDLLFLAQAHLERLHATYLDGPADLVVEIISPESGARDRGDKFYEYEAGGVPEYWLLDQLRTWAECYRLGADGRYRTAFAGNAGRYHAAALPGFWLRIEWLWQRPLPDVTRTAWQILGVERLRQLVTELERQPPEPEEIL